VRHLRYVEPGRVEWQDTGDPVIDAQTDAIVRPLAVARCDLDASMATDGLFPGPYTVGHETVAEIVAVGDAVRGHRVGDVVIVPFQVSCGHCIACQDDRYAACHVHRAPGGAAFGFGPAGGDHGGAVADLLLVPDADHLLVGAPADLDPLVACTLPDNVLDGYRAVAPGLAARPGSEVLVVGGAAASIGLYAVGWAVGLGASRVRYVDSDPARCAAAEALGATAEQFSGVWPRRFGRAPITVDNTAEPDGLAAAIRSTDDFGLCTVVGVIFGPPTPLPMLDMYTKGITLHIARADARRLLPEVLDLVTRGVLDPLAIPTTVVDWEDAADAWMAPATKLVVSRRAAA
jgi:threonine dehydrogenase-like Zn-dependent dehydrogenase